MEKKTNKKSALIFAVCALLSLLMIFGSFTLQPLATDAESARITLIAMEAVSFFVMLLILYGIEFQNGVNDRKSRRFEELVILTLIALFADMISWQFDGQSDYPVIRYVTNYLAMIMGCVLPIPFVYYEYEYCCEKRRVPLWPARWIAAFNFLIIGILTIATIMGKAFTFENNTFQMGDIYILSVVGPFLSLIGILFTIFYGRKIFGKRDTRVFLAYVLIPLVTVVVELVNEDLQIGFVVASFSVLLIYILLQAGKTNELQVRQNVLEQICRVDQVTNLNNRLAYNQVLEQDAYPLKTGVLFCDVNGLKKVNDTIGHKAGDELLKQFSDILLEYFDYDAVFRISGDEFVVIFKGIEEEELWEQRDRFRARMKENNNLASVGGAFGDAEKIENVINRAENEMYQEKNRYHMSQKETE